MQSNGSDIYSNLYEPMGPLGIALGIAGSVIALLYRSKESQAKRELEDLKQDKRNLLESIGKQRKEYRDELDRVNKQAREDVAAAQQEIRELVRELSLHARNQVTNSRQ